MKVKGKEMDYNKSWFSTQPIINPRKVAFVNSDEVFPLNENEDSVHDIKIEELKKQADPYDKEYEEEGSKEEEN